MKNKKVVLILIKMKKEDLYKNKMRNNFTRIIECNKKVTKVRIDI